VEAGLALKGLDYRRVDLMFGLSAAQQMLRFGRRTVPGLMVGRQKVVGSRLILRTIDGLSPDPPLVPHDPEHRAAVDAADEWGDAVLQEHVRWIALSAVARCPEALPSFLEGYQVPTLPAWAAKHARIGVQIEGRLLGHTPSTIRDQYLPALPGNLDRVDRLIADGVIGNDLVNVADLQIASSVRLLLNFEDLRDHIEARPCGGLARRLIAKYPGSAPKGCLQSPFTLA
jgi:glutathione S-transferase